ncbi:MAG: hypothetical protein WA885_18480 [Phormidesmis sp.]
MVFFNQCRLRLQRMAVQAVCLLMVALSVWGGAWVPAAAAVGSQEAADVMNARAAAELDRVAGAGTSDQVSGTVDSTVGKAKRAVGGMDDGLDSATKRLDGATDQVQGKVKRDVGRAKSKASEVGDDLEDTSEGIVESIKDFFD